MIKTYKNIIAWNKAHELALSVYRLTMSFPVNERFVLVSQIRRSAVSVASNIVEGFARKSKKESLRFYDYSKASLEELKYQLFLASELTFIKEKEYNKVENLSNEVGRTLNGWIKSQL